MNTKTLLALFTSKARMTILELFFLNKNSDFYVREIEKKTGLSIGSIQKELKNLSNIDLLKKRRRGNRLYYTIYSDHLIFEELLSIIRKYLGIIPALKDSLDCDKINTAFIFGSMAKENYNAESDIDIMVIGDISAKILSGLLRNIKTEYELNYILFSEKELREKNKKNEPFVKRILSDKKIFIKGNSETIRKIIG
ncbi:nucleotidyltransferase domain-containing protein [candidate division WOR-3 bacterium]|nr:nucleotidyltransferase domain-containing protein [candidate division WOR-3 bacterium]